MKPNPQLEKRLARLLESYSPRVEVSDNVYRISVSLGSKRAVVTWPYPLHEVFIDFWDSESKLLSESFEFYDGESDAELLDYLASVLKCFLTNPTRVHVEGKLLKTQELQYRKGDTWSTVF